MATPEPIRDPILDRPLPSSPETEKAILGAIILDNTLVSQAIELLKPGDFYVPSHRRIFTAMIALFERGSEINPILIAEEMRKDNSLDSSGGVLFLTNLTYGLPHVTSIAQYAKVVRGKSLLRQLVKVANKITAEALEEEDEPQHILDHAEHAIFALADERIRQGFEHIKHPVSVARMVMEKTPHIILAGDGALQFALANGFTKQNLLTPASEKAWKEWLKTAKYEPVKNIENQLYDKKTDKTPGGSNNHDTIGMVAMDTHGNFGGSCTTSGAGFKMRGRLGDSPIIGAGLFVDNEVGACTATGQGEDVIRMCGSHTVVELMRQGMSPEQACKAAVERIIRIKGEKAKEIQVAFLALNKKGETGAFAIQKGFSYALKSNKEERMYTAKSWY